MKPFVKGQKDFQEGNLENPFNPDTQRHREWQRGFDKAYYKNLEKVLKREQREAKKTNH